MPVLTDWNLAIDADKVLWGQGADPAVIRKRRPALVETAESVIAEGTPWLKPVVAYRRLPVEGLRHEHLSLADGGRLFGPLIAKHLAGACDVVAAVCTVGDGLSSYASDMFQSDPVRSLAFEGLAAAAAEALAEAACQYFEAMADSEGLKASVPLNPGMIGWPLLEGQRQIFGLVDTHEIGVSLTPEGLMRPLKSLSLVVGLGRDLADMGRTCDFCSMHGTCRFGGDHDAIK